MPEVLYASFPIARSSSPTQIANTTFVTAPKNDGTFTNVEAVPADVTRSYVIIRNNSPYQIVYGYEDINDLDVQGMVLNPSDSAVLTSKSAIYLRSLGVAQDANVRLDIGTA